MKSYSRNAYISLFICLLTVFLIHAQESATKQKAVLVTGASSGIGLKITEQLSNKGYFVYAGARKQEDLERLSTIKNVQSIKLDVTKWDEINAAVETIKKEGRGLYGLVNNAGVGIWGAFTEVKEEDLEFILNVNVYGPYRVTKAFAPLIIESKGRITNISSISGVGSPKGGLFNGPYNMSKHAVEAYNDALATELKKFDVQVSAIEPGSYNSKILENMIKRMKANYSSYENSLYKEDIDKFIASGGDRSKDKDPAEVAEAVEKALFSDNPKPRYMVVPNEKQAHRTITKVMRQMVQLNENQAYKYDRETLIKMLDKVLAETE
ncbi:SDR family oxidoreductase [Seonamhaeicola maritimus]|uniref:SDR family oxidoreductase n=1 Tax=Seonamhaeicola maritimus TaxID=2591822 RepID=UPI002494F658|nr:SDR family oxidoreductase [Seonamhaeicola maritimus]